MKCCSAKKIALLRKTSFLVFFGVFLAFEHSCSLKLGEPCEKCCKQQLQGLRKLEQGAQGTVLAFVCRKSANVVPEKCKEVEKGSKEYPKHKCTRV